MPDTLAAVLAKDVDWSRLPPTVPASLRRLLKRCIEKDRQKRLADISDARLDLADALTSEEILSVAPVASVASGVRGWMVLAAGVWSGDRCRCDVVDAAGASRGHAARLSHINCSAAPDTLPSQRQQPNLAGDLARAASTSRSTVAMQSGAMRVWLRPLDTGELRTPA